MFDLCHGLEDARLERRSPLLRLPAQNRDAGFVIGDADVHDEAARKPRDQTLVQVRDFGRRAIAGEHDLMPRLLQRFGEAQQLGLHLLAIGEELNVVHQQDVHILEAAAEIVSLSRRDRCVE